MMQIDHTVSILRKLESDRHRGPVVIITKGDCSLFPKADFDLRLMFALSTFGVDHRLDGGTLRRFEKNLQWCRENGKKFSIEFRPIVYGVNDSDDAFSRVTGLAAKYGVPVAYSGLQGKPEVVKTWGDDYPELRPYPGTTLGFKKTIGTEAESRLRQIAKDQGVQLFRKTSCSISSVLGTGRDYSAHYYRPNEVGCAECAQKGGCLGHKNDPTARTIELLPFKHEVKHAEKHQCILANSCKFPTPDCSNIKGKLVYTDEKLTLADVRVTKWLTGMTVAAKFTDSPYLSDFWNKA
jgi:hypothetical protein